MNRWPCVHGGGGTVFKGSASQMVPPDPLLETEETTAICLVGSMGLGWELMVVTLI